MMNFIFIQKHTVVLGVLAVAIAGGASDSHAATIQKHAVNAELPPGENPTYEFGDRVLWLIKGQGPVAEVVTRVSKSTVSWIKGDLITYEPHVLV